MKKPKTSQKKEIEPPDKRKKIVLGATENIFIEGKKFGAKIDTGADKSSICKGLLKELNTYEDRGHIKILSAHGKSIRRKIVLRILIKGKEVKAHFTIADRKKLTCNILIGKNILKKGFLVDVTK